MARRPVTAPDRLRAVATAAPRILAGGVMPSVCFVLGHRSLGLLGAVLLTVGWTAGYQLVLRLGGRPWSVLCTLNLFELLTRSAVALALGSDRAFFLVPSTVTFVFGAAYVLSALAGRPLLALIVAEVLPGWVPEPGGGQADASVPAPAGGGLLRDASVVYGAEQMTVAVLSMAMALRLPATTYATVHPPISWSVFGLGLLVLMVLRRRRSDAVSV